MNARFFCHHEKCGRAFVKEEDLKIHLERRHMEQQNQEVPEEKNEFQLRIMAKLFGPKTSKISCQNTETLSKSLILESSGQDSLENITEVISKQLILRNKNLKEFTSSESVNLDDLTSLEYLSLSHNSLAKIDGVTYLLGLRELNLNNNNLIDISPIGNLIQLIRLFLSNNQILTILPLKSLKQIVELSINNNQLTDLDLTLKTLGDLPKLKSLDIEPNPCTIQNPNTKYKILHKLKLETLDSDQITDIDKQITFNILGDTDAFTSKSIVGRLRANNDYQGNNEREMLAQEIEELKEKIKEVSKERDLLAEEKAKAKKEDVGALKDENLRLKREVASMYLLLDEVNVLREKLREGLGSYASEIYEENQRLRTRVLEMEKKQDDNSLFRRPHTSAGVRPATAVVKEPENDELIDFIERNNRMLANLETKVKSFKSDLKKYGK